jgi:KDO2-lipid IV(A) lauroyltransferase
LRNEGFFNESVMSRLFFFMIIKPLSYFPLFVLYYFSDVVYLVVYKLVGYRTKVVNQNLKNSFPDKTVKEIQRIQDGFYRHLCDLIVESIKLFSISSRELKKRFVMLNAEILDRFFDEGRSVILVGGHYNNYEMAGIGINFHCPHQAIGIYAPLSNSFFERAFAKSRSRFGVELVKMKEVAETFENNKKRTTMTIFLSDQSPTYSKFVHWTTFLNQETAVHLGAERFARQYDQPVLFFTLHKVKRGYYEGSYELLCEAPVETPDGEITELHVRALERLIYQDPRFWLWSHKRWKRKREVDTPA